jgi:hypothetical protein
MVNLWELLLTGSKYSQRPTYLTHEMVHKPFNKFPW